MANADGDEDLKLHQASTSLLTDLKDNLTSLLRRPSGRAHRIVKDDDLHRTAEPQLLDTQLKTIVPPIVDVYLEAVLGRRESGAPRTGCVSVEHAVCVLLYTLSKVRGYRIIMGFLNNEPRYLEPVLERLETFSTDTKDTAAQWQIPYVLLLWLSHLLLTPFALNTISAKSFMPQASSPDLDTLLSEHEPLTGRCLQVALQHLSASTKAQDAASVLITRILIRPDVQSVKLEDGLLKHQLGLLESGTVTTTASQYEQIGCLKLLARMVASAELERQVPQIFDRCQVIFEGTDDVPAAANAVGKKLGVKIFRNIALTALNSASLGGVLLPLLEESGLLEYVIDYSLRSLADKDTPVRLAAAKAISAIVLELDPSMGHEVVQAVLDTFKEDIPRTGGSANFATVDPLKWHGLTLTLAHVLFRRSASPDQLPDIVSALFFALQFQQRTATGTLLGTNVRDAANFGIWSLARRYTTRELADVDVGELALHRQRHRANSSIIQILAVELLLSACFDPAGNIRRGSSAALQELIGRHPDEVISGIALVQIVDYQAVGLRNRAMVDVASQAAALDALYWKALLLGLLDWRGLGSADVASRESAAVSIAAFWVAQPASDQLDGVARIVQQLKNAAKIEAELYHGHLLAIAHIIREGLLSSKVHLLDSVTLWGLLPLLDLACAELSPRVLRSELPASITQFLTELTAMDHSSNTLPTTLFATCDKLIARLLTAHEDWTSRLLPPLVKVQFHYRRSHALPMGPIDIVFLTDKTSADCVRSGLHGAGRTVALGALLPEFQALQEYNDATANAVSSLCNLLRASNVDWRIVGAKAINLALQGMAELEPNQTSHIYELCLAVERGLNDYSIDERGDIGSLVRLQSIQCASTIFASDAHSRYEAIVDQLRDNICRLSLEKLDRVRMLAAQCRKMYLNLEVDVSDVTRVSSLGYFEIALQPLTSEDATIDTRRALLLGCISCAGCGAESVLQASRQVLVRMLTTSSVPMIEAIFTELTNVTKNLVSENANNVHAALELLAFLLEAGVADRLASSESFRWRSLFVAVQKAHYKSSDIPRLLAAVRAYSGLSRVIAIRSEVLKRLIGMLRTNPYPRVRLAIAETLWLTTSDADLLTFDATIPPTKQTEVIQKLEQRYDELEATA